ncbi:hypothetical protein E8E14_005954 [Neopestalotiopsis sp. 37M]|nr:hypothetical protein E8E14_005954 [Neopestalotiopsis sp. 37M]
MNQISRFCGVMLILGAAGWVANFLLVFCWVSFSELGLRRAKCEAFSALLAKEAGWFDCVPGGTSSLLVQIHRDFKDLRNATHFGLGNISVDVVTAIANISVALYFSWKLTLVILASVPISIIILAILGGKIDQALELQKQQLALASRQAASAVTAIDMVKVCNGADQEIWQYSEYVKRSMQAHLVQSRIYSLQGSYVKLWLECLFAVAFYYGAKLHDQGLSSGDLVTTFYAALNGLRAMEAIVSFAYPSNAASLVLNDCSLQIPAGRMTFLVGPSGAGKSTIIDLLVKLYEPASGEVILDGNSIQKLDTAWVRSNVALVQQKDALFDDTLYRNIILGVVDPAKISESNMENVAAVSQSHSIIGELPNGLQTRIGINGQHLSGGQRQRLLLARALIRDSAILVLDEAMTGLDSATRGQVMNSIRKWRQQKTTIVITHDTAQIRSNDHVCVIKDGRTIREGHFQRAGSGEIAMSSESTGDSYTRPAHHDSESSRQPIQLPEIRSGATATFFAQYSMSYAGQSWVNSLRTEAFWRILHQPRSFFDKPKHSAAIIAICLGQDAEDASDIIVRFVPGVLMMCIMVISTVSLALAVNWRLSLVALSSGSLLFAVIKAYSYVMDKCELHYTEMGRCTHCIMADAITKLRTVKVTSAEHYFQKKHGDSAAHCLNLGIKKAAWTAVLFASWQTIFWLIIPLIIYYATILLTSQQRPDYLEGLLRVINLLVLGLAATTQMTDSIPSISVARAASERLLYYATLPVPDDEDSPRKDTPSTGLHVQKVVEHRNGRTNRKKKQLLSPFPIRMNGLSFAYQSSAGLSPRSVLNNINLVIESGSSIAVTGHSGCGKSLLATLLLNIRRPAHIPRVRDVRPSINRHSLSFAGLPPEMVDVTELQTQMAYVSQQPFLFPTTIRGNIIYGLPESSELLDPSNVECAARRAGILDFVNSLPDGLNTLVGDGGQDLSGGQTQRICLARALVRRPKLLVLDEPTSALDPDAAEDIQRTITQLIQPADNGPLAPSWRPCDSIRGHVNGGSTVKSLGQESAIAVVLITHSVELMKVCDKIAVIDDGRVVEQGTFGELLNTNGRLVELIGSRYNATEKSKHSSPPGSQIGIPLARKNEHGPYQSLKRLPCQQQELATNPRIKAGDARRQISRSLGAENTCSSRDSREGDISWPL